MSRFVPQDGEFSLEEHDEWALKLWRRMDRDHTESITREELDCDEFRTILASIVTGATRSTVGGVLYERATMNMDQAISFCLRKADQNMDNSLSFEEFKAFTLCLRRDHDAKSSANLIFALFDLDSDGHIDEAEFREIFRFFVGHNPTEKEFQAEWARLDFAGKRRVSRGEYIRWLQRSKNPVFKRHAPPREPPGAQQTSALSKSGSAGSLHHAAGGGDSLDLLRRHRSGPDRPVWNQLFNTKKSINECAPQGKREYFMRPQSLPELSRHYDNHRGFRLHQDKLKAPEKPKPIRVLSTDTGNCFAFNPGTALPGGRMRNTHSGRLTPWEDHWQMPLCAKKKIRPGTLDLKCPGQPPEWMFAEDGEGF